MTCLILAAAGLVGGGLLIAILVALIAAALVYVLAGIVLPHPWPAVLAVLVFLLVLLA